MAIEKRLYVEIPKRYNSARKQEGESDVVAIVKVIMGR